MNKDKSMDFLLNISKEARWFSSILKKEIRKKACHAKVEQQYIMLARLYLPGEMQYKSGCAISERSILQNQEILFAKGCPLSKRESFKCDF